MSVAIFLFLLVQLVVVTIGDIKYRKIRNSWVLINLLIAAGFFIFNPNVYIFSIESFQFSLAFFVGGFLLYLLKIMGGGDSKYLASFFLLVPLKQQVYFFYYLLISTVIVGVIIFLRNTFINRGRLIEAIKTSNLQEVKNCFGTKFAYAPVILLAWVYFGTELYIN